MAKVFTAEDEWGDIRPKALIEALRTKLMAERKGAREVRGAL